MDFAEWLKTYRAENKVSLRGLSERIDFLCSDAFLSQIENRRYIGKKGRQMSPDIETVDALAKALGRPINEARTAANYALITEIPKEIQALDFSVLNKEQVDDIVEYAQYKIYKMQIEAEPKGELRPMGKTDATGELAEKANKKAKKTA